MMRFYVGNTMIGALLVCVLGCGGGGTSPVSGKVTFNDGSPVPGGRVTFVGSGTDAINATGNIGADGSYTLTTFQPGDGAPPGKYSVAILAMEPDTRTYDPEKGPVGEASGGPLIDEKYFNSSTSGLTADVSEGTNNIDFTVDPPK